MLDAFEHAVIILAKHIMREFNKPALVHNGDRFLEIVTNDTVYFRTLIVKLHLEILNHIHNFILAGQCRG